MTEIRLIVCLILLGISGAGNAINQMIFNIKIKKLEQQLQQLQKQLEKK